MLAFLPSRRHTALAATVLLAALAPHPAGAARFALTAGQRLVGKTGAYVTRAHDLLPDLAIQYDLGYTELLAANAGVRPWAPTPGTRLTIPGSYILPERPHKGIVINLAAQRLFYFPPGQDSVETFPVGIGRKGHATPHGRTRIAWKEANPVWRPTASIRAEEPDLPAAIGPGPDDPLGAYALHLGWPGYLVHGTNKPYGIGRLVSHGCIRLYPNDIDRLFHEVTVGTPVRVIDDRVMVAWAGDTLYAQVYPGADEAAAIDAGKRERQAFPESLVEKVATDADARHAAIDWDAVARTGFARNGIPTAVAHAPIR